MARYTAKDDGLNGNLRPLSTFVTPLLTDMYQVSLAYFKKQNCTTMCFNLVSNSSNLDHNGILIMEK